MQRHKHFTRYANTQHTSFNCPDNSNKCKKSSCFFPILCAWRPELRCDYSDVIEITSYKWSSVIHRQDSLWFEVVVFSGLQVKDDNGNARFLSILDFSVLPFLLVESEQQLLIINPAIMQNHGVYSARQVICFHNCRMDAQYAFLSSNFWILLVCDSQ